jgi:hypothetical protein
MELRQDSLCVFEPLLVETFSCWTGGALMHESLMFLLCEKCWSVQGVLWQVAASAGPYQRTCLD